MLATDLDSCWSRGKSNQGAGSFIANSRAAGVKEVVDASDESCSLSWVRMVGIRGSSSSGSFSLQRNLSVDPRINSFGSVSTEERARDNDVDYQKRPSPVACAGEHCHVKKTVPAVEVLYVPTSTDCVL
ncbi:hypothetical protein E2C01_008173 [Portunus trituberculatus]|uniref:Uncharacterized protein n=1 Tax=Portunus trituberculatus TaxID=210409 RepID=A0A5B7D031_PORTR|nr:hypothetical protein [Portunus trituberculatus]